VHGFWKRVVGFKVLYKKQKIYKIKKQARIMETLFTSEQIQSKVKELAEQIAKDHSEVFCVPMLKGAIIFFSDLIRELSKQNVKVQFDLVQISSYTGKVRTGTKVKKDVGDVEGKDILIVEDIIETGRSPKFLKEHLLEVKKAKSVKICALLDKPMKREVDIKLDYIGFEVPDKWIVGYGTDCDEKYRELPFIGFID
jgi:hypoxanthine phosphoribosyltransferase